MRRMRMKSALTARCKKSLDHSLRWRQRLRVAAGLARVAAVAVRNGSNSGLSILDCYFWCGVGSVDDHFASANT